jgi:hypothetical protein
MWPWDRVIPQSVAAPIQCHRVIHNYWADTGSFQALLWSPEASHLCNAHLDLATPSDLHTSQRIEVSNMCFQISHPDHQVRLYGGIKMNGH